MDAIPAVGYANAFIDFVTAIACDFSDCYISQSSINKLLMRWNSLVLWVMRVKLFVRVMAAICKSYAPMGVPNASS